MLSIQTNGAALAVQRNLSTSASAVQSASAALSSGSRVRTAKDDAAGLGIATRMSSVLVTNRALARGVNDGISIVQTAEGALGGISDILQRCMELAAQAANGALSDGDRAFANTEAQALLAEVNHIASTTAVFGKSPLHAPEIVPAQSPVLTSRGTTPSLQALVGPNGSDGVGGNRLWMQPPGARVVGYVPAGLKNVELGMNSAFGDVDLQLFAADGTHIAGTPITDPTWAGQGISSSAAMNASVVTTASGFDAGASYNGSPLIQANPSPSTPYDNALSPPGAQGTFRGMTISYTGDGDRFADDTNAATNATDSYHGVEAIKIDDVKAPLFAVISASGSWSFGANWDASVASTKPGGNLPVDIVVGAADGQVDSIRVDNTPADTASLGLSSLNLGTESGARAAIDALQSAMRTISQHRATYGALSNRFDVVASNLAQQSIDVEGARGRILDADIAEVVTYRARSQVLQDASTALLGQASRGAEAALSLLR